MLLVKMFLVILTPLSIFMTAYVTTGRHSFFFFSEYFKSCFLFLITQFTKKNSLCVRWVRDAKDARPLPTYIPKDAEEKHPENIYAEDVHPYDEASIMYEVVDTPVVRTGAKIAKAKGAAKK